MRIATLIIIVCGLVMPTATAAPIDDLGVTPLPVKSNCYAGTPGQDNVMYWRANPFLDCQPFSGPASPCLIRREAGLGDPADGNPVSLFAGPFLRPSLSGAGDVVIFSEYGFNICLMNSSSDSTEGCFGRDFLGIDPHTGFFHPDGTQVAVTRLDPDNTFEPTNDIFIANPNTFVTEEIYEVTDLVNLYKIDTVDFTVSGTHLIIDAQNASTGLWGIYAIPRGGPYPAVVAPIPLVPPVANLVIRNPQLAQTSDDFIVFDAYDLTTGINHVVTAHIISGATQIVASVAANFTSYPTYTGDDSAVVFSVPDAATLTTFSLDIQPLAGDRMTPAGARSQFQANGYAPVVYRRGAWDGSRQPEGSCDTGPDADGDGVADSVDNCIDVMNADQRDTNGDGIGNVCDADIDNNCLVNFLDSFSYRDNFFMPGDLDTDNNGDGNTNFIDLMLLSQQFFGPPGPSATGCN